MNHTSNFILLYSYFMYSCQTVKRLKTISYDIENEFSNVGWGQRASVTIQNVISYTKLVAASMSDAHQSRACCDSCLLCCPSVYHVPGSHNHYKTTSLMYNSGTGHVCHRDLQPSKTCEPVASEQTFGVLQTELCQSMMILLYFHSYKFYTAIIKQNVWLSLLTLLIKKPTTFFFVLALWCKYVLFHSLFSFVQWHKN